VELFQQGGGARVDVLRAVVAVEAKDDEGEGLEQGGQDRQENVLADALDAADELERGDLVDQVDVVEPLDPIEIALVDGIDPQEARTSLGAGTAPLADADLDRPGLVHPPPAAPVGLGAPQVVQMAVGDPGQALVADLAEDLPGALTELARGRPREVAMQGIDLGQQAHVLGRVAACKGLGGRAAPVPQHLPLLRSPHQARERRSR